jgi:hypothetical protein
VVAYVYPSSRVLLAYKRFATWLQGGFREEQLEGVVVMLVVVCLLLFVYIPLWYRSIITIRELKIVFVFSRVP